MIRTGFSATAKTIGRGPDRRRPPGGRRGLAVAGLATALLIVASVNGVSPPVAAADPIAEDLFTWTQEGPPNAGNWIVSADGSGVGQYINGNPTVFLRPGDGSGSFSSIVSVGNDGDDDFIGFVLGFDPGV